MARLTWTFPWTIACALAASLATSALATSVAHAADAALIEQTNEGNPQPFGIDLGGVGRHSAGSQTADVDMVSDRQSKADCDRRIHSISPRTKNLCSGFARQAAAARNHRMLGKGR